MILGTAQLGMDYGIANRLGRPSSSGSVEIIATAWENGVRCFDTASAYGDSELVLGRAFAELGIARHVSVISKFGADLLAMDGPSAGAMIEQSLERLGIPRLWALLLHAEDHLEH